jgi:HAD superfamily hydrolase (TIGR01509 family)
MDGTLIDSEEFHWISWRDTMAQEGIAIGHEEFLASFGRRNDAILSHWLGSAATPERIERVGNAKEVRYRDLVRKNGMAPLPGVAKWLQELHEQRWLQAIASAAPRANVDAILKALGAADYFQAIVSAEDVHVGKPDPEVYLVAAARAGASPDRCIVVEDAVAGIKGARRAGMRSIGVGHNSQHLAADVMVQSLDLLDPDAFDRLVGRASE